MPAVPDCSHIRAAGLINKGPALPARIIAHSQPAIDLLIWWKGEKTTWLS